MAGTTGTSKTNIPEVVRSKRRTGSIKTLSFPSKPLPHSIQMVFHDYDYSKYAASFQLEEGAGFIASGNLGFVDSKAEIRVEEGATASLELPFPRTLRDATQTQVTAFERDFLYERAASAVAGIVGGSAGDTAGNMAKIMEDALSSARAAGKGVAKNGIGDTISKAIEDTFKVNADTALALGAYIGRKFLTGDLAKTASTAIGTIINPQQTLAFEGVNLREFTFEWDLFPANRQDTEKITQIVRMLKSKMLPETAPLEGVRGLERAFLKYPSVVELSLIGVQEKHFVRFKRAMIDNVTVDYTGGGSLVSIIKGGVPASVTLSVSFKELTIQTAEDYEDAGSSYGDDSTGEGGAVTDAAAAQTGP